jgi:hypothetical protein
VKLSTGIAAILLAGELTGAFAAGPPGGESYIFSPPEGFKLGMHSARGRSLMEEWVPPMETVEGWTKIITVNVHVGLQMDSATYLQRIGGGFKTACPGTTDNGIGNGHANGYPVSMVLLRCPANPGTGKPETTLFRAIRGAEALFAVQYAWRTVPSPDEISEAAHLLSKALICDTRDSAHSCPEQHGDEWKPLDLPKTQDPTGS